MTKLDDLLETFCFDSSLLGEKVDSKESYDIKNNELKIEQVFKFQKNDDFYLKRTS